MATRRGPRFKECRRLGVNVCGHPKAMNRANAPAFKKTHKVSEYGLQLIEKQKVKAYYGILERQLRRYYTLASKKAGKTGAELICMLECRLDNVVYRLGFANSRAQARQLINHRHFSVNGKGTDIPSFIVKEGDIIAVKEGSRDAKIFKEIMADENIAARIATPAWLELNKDEMKGKVIRLPEREDLPQDVKENLIVELYSK